MCSQLKQKNTQNNIQNYDVLFDDHKNVNAKHELTVGFLAARRA